MTDDKTQTPAADRAGEVKAMGKVAEALANLDTDAVARVLRWAVDAYGVAVGGAGRTGGAGRGSGVGSGSGSDTGGGGHAGTQFADLAELYAATAPESEPDKALVAAYWAQYGEGKSEFGSQEINTALKNLGHPIGNITGAFTALKARKPAAVMQVKKSGTTRQARKTYKLTQAGKTAVEALVSER